MNWRNPLWLTVLGGVLAAVLAAVAVRRHSFNLELLDGYTGADEEPADQPLD